MAGAILILCHNGVSSGVFETNGHCSREGKDKEYALKIPFVAEPVSGSTKANFLEAIIRFLIATKDNKRF